MPPVSEKTASEPRGDHEVYRVTGVVHGGRRRHWVIIHSCCVPGPDGSICGLFDEGRDGPAPRKKASRSVIPVAVPVTGPVPQVPRGPVAAATFIIGKSLGAEGVLGQKSNRSPCTASHVSQTVFPRRVRRMSRARRSPKMPSMHCRGRNPGNVSASGWRRLRRILAIRQSRQKFWSRAHA